MTWYEKCEELKHPDECVKLISKKTSVKSRIFGLALNLKSCLLLVAQLKRRNELMMMMVMMMMPTFIVHDFINFINFINLYISVSN